MTDFIPGEPLSKHTTLKIGGPAKFFVEATSEEEIVKAIKKAQKENIPFILIGEGSNLLVSDSGFDGLVIKNNLRGITIKDGLIRVKSGTALQELVDFSVEKGFAGMQKMTGIPGTVGGAIYGNAGAYGQTISDHLERVRVFDGASSFWVEKRECNFSYRESAFKKNKFILLEAEFRLDKGKKESLVKEKNETLAVRLRKYKPGIACPGSYFKNIQIKDLKKEQLTKIPKDKIVYEKIPAGYLLEVVGAKRAKRGDIEIADFHANLFINKGKGTAEDFFALAEEFKQKVKEKFAIVLEPEVQLIGDWPESFKGKKVAVLGLGMEGKDTVNFLLKQGAEITVFDVKPEEELDFSGIDRSKIALSTGKDYLKKGVLDFDWIFRSPGIYRYIPEIVEAEAGGVKISSAVKLFFELCPAKIIGVTGTKGKGTTSSLIYEILKRAGKDAFLAGNIGVPYLELLPKLTKDSLVVLELSSFQLLDMEASPTVAVVLNITEDHLNWHKDLEEYIAAKKNIVKYQKSTDFSVMSADYQVSESFSASTKAKVYKFSRKNKVKGAYALDGKVYLSVDTEILLGETKELLLRGEHNLENITAASVVGGILNTSPEIIWKAAVSFKGLEHRLELVGAYNGISFYNDSFATSPAPTIAAVKSFTEPLTLILGGSEKGLDYKELGAEIAKAGNIVSVILIGQVAPKIKDALGDAGYQGRIVEKGKASMNELVKEAFLNTPKGGVILLSPAAASFDMFKDYKDRGLKFKSAVKALG